MSDTRRHVRPGWGPGNPKFEALWPTMTAKELTRDRRPWGRPPHSRGRKARATRYSHSDRGGRLSKRSLHERRIRLAAEESALAVRDALAEQEK